MARRLFVIIPKFLHLLLFVSITVISITIIAFAFLLGGFFPVPVLLHVLVPICFTTLQFILVF